MSSFRKDSRGRETLDYIMRTHLGVYHKSYLNTPIDGDLCQEYLSLQAVGLNQERFIDGSIETIPTLIESMQNSVVRKKEKDDIRTDPRCPICDKIPILSYGHMKKHQCFYSYCMFRNIDKHQDCSCKCKDCGTYVSMCKCAIRCGQMYRIEEKQSIYNNLQEILGYCNGNLPVLKIIMGYVDAFARNENNLYRLKCKSCLVQVPVLNPWLSCPELCNPMVWIGVKNNVQWECPFCAVIESEITNEKEMATFVKNKIERCNECFDKKNQPGHTYIGGIKLQKIMNTYFYAKSRSNPRRFQKHINRKMKEMTCEEYELGLTTIPDQGKDRYDTFTWLLEKLTNTNNNKKEDEDCDFYGHPLYTQEPWFSFINRMSDTEFKQSYWNCITFAEYGPEHKVITKLCNLPVHKVEEQSDQYYLLRRLHKTTFGISTNKNTERFKDFIQSLDETPNYQYYQRTYETYLEKAPRINDHDYDPEYDMVYSEYMDHDLYQYGLKHGFDKHWFSAKYYKSVVKEYRKDPKNKKEKLTSLDQYKICMDRICTANSIRCNGKELSNFVFDKVYNDGMHDRETRIVFHTDTQEYECRFYEGNDFRDYDSHNLTCPVQYFSNIY